MWIYDVEVLGGNFFSAYFLNVKTKEEFYCWKCGTQVHNIHKLKNFLKDAFLIGYNNHVYDDLILNFILQSDGAVDTMAIKILSDKIIDNEEPVWKNDELKRYTEGVQSLDLMKVLAFDKLRIGLKQCSVNLYYDKIEDLVHPPDCPVNLEEVDKIMKYNRNDVLITYKLFEHLRDALNLRYSLSNKYNVNLLSASKTYIGKAVLNKYYEEYTGRRSFEFRNVKTRRNSLDLKDCISPNLKFESKTFQKLLSSLKARSVKIQPGKKAKGVNDLIIFNGKGYQLGFGGLHSVDGPGKFISDDKHKYIDCDVDSYYPQVMINDKIKPEHLDDEYFDILIDLTSSRLKAKKTKDKITDSTLKITINSIFGLLNFEEYWLYDPKAAYTVTLSGQLYLLKLIEMLELAGFEVISANTDGVVTKVPTHLEELYYQVCDRWCEETRFNLSYTIFNKYVRKDVNNYLVVPDKGDIKQKGCFYEKQELEKGYNTSIIAKALNNYFVNDIPVMETIKNETDIFAFCISQKVGGQFTTEFHHIVDDQKKIEHLQKTNRYFIARSGGTILKRRKDNPESITNLHVDFQVQLLNNYDPDEDYLSNVNYGYYSQRCSEIIEAIEDKQLSLSFVQ